MTWKISHKLWELDAIGIREEKFLIDELNTYQKSLDTIQYFDNKYRVHLPWKTSHPPLPYNHFNAHAQFYSLYLCHRNEPELFKYYDMIIKEQAELGFMELILSSA